MKVQSFLKSAVALAVVAGASVTAQAATYNLGVLTVGGPPTSFNAFHAGAGLSQFDDDFTFSLATDGFTAGSVLDFSIPGIVGAQFASANLYSGMPGTGTLIAQAVGTTSSMSFTNVFTPAGTYYLAVAGNVTGGVSLGAAYSGSINVSPIPEPESYAMLLAGLGVMGAIAARRNKAKKQS